MAGRKIVCPHCGQRLLIPNPEKPAEGSNTILGEPLPVSSHSLTGSKLDWLDDLRTVESYPAPGAVRVDGEMAAESSACREKTLRLAGLLLSLGLLFLLGWLMWIFPQTPPQPKAAFADQEQLVRSLDRMNRLPLLQEVERSPRDDPAPMPPQRRPPLAPLSVVENRPPDLPPPVRSPKDDPKKQPPPSYSNQTEADSLREELVKAGAQQQDGLLEKLRKGKGPEYTEALAEAIGQLSSEAKKKARRTLADRLTRFTANTLLAYLGSENPELRRAAALALGMKDEKDHISELIDMLDDPEPSVVQAVHAALKSLTSPDTAPEDQTQTRPARTGGAKAQASSSRQPMPPPEAKPPGQGSQVRKAKQQTKDEDVPDVSLVPPEETSSSVKAIIQANALALSSRSASERIQAAQVLGGLGEAGKPARRFLCAAMLDPVVAVRVAAADALKNVDPKLHYLAVVLATEKVGTMNDAARIVTLLKKIQKLEEDGEPLAPIVAYVVKFATSNGAIDLFTTALATLTHIGRKDLSSYRIIATALSNRDPAIRALALRGLARMKHGKLAVPRILVLVRIDTPANRIAAIETLATLADESTEEIIYSAINAQRYHSDEGVRRAVEAALNKLENKHDS
jgi:HEAT repeat protein